MDVSHVNFIVNCFGDINGIHLYHLYKEACTQIVTNVDPSYTFIDPSTSLCSMFMQTFILARIAKDFEAFRAPGLLA